MRPKFCVAVGLAFSLLFSSSLALAETTSQSTNDSVSSNTGSEEKHVVPTVSKEVSVDGVSWSDRIDAPSFSHVSYRVTGMLPDNEGIQKLVDYAFVDKHDSSIVVDKSTVKVSLVSSVSGESRDVTNVFEISMEQGVMTVSCDDVRKSLPDLSSDSYFLLTYEADLGKTLDIGLFDPNENACHVTYLLTGDSPESTPDDITFVYAYALDVTKVENGTSTKLAGAKFAVCDSSGLWLSNDGWIKDENQRELFTTGKDGQVLISALGTGTYRLVEVEAPEGYSIANPVSFTISRNTKGGQSGISADAKNGKVTSVNADEGRVSLLVEDTKTGSSGVTGSVGSVVSGPSGSVSGGGALSKTGDETSVVPIVALSIGGLCVLAIGVANIYKKC